MGEVLRFVTFKLASPDNPPGVCACKVRSTPRRLKDEPIARERRPTKQRLYDANILPYLFPIADLHGFKAKAGPAVDQRFDVSRTHGAISEEVSVVPDTTTEQGRVVTQTLLPPARILLVNFRTRHHEVDEL